MGMYRDAYGVAVVACLCCHDDTLEFNSMN